MSDNTAERYISALLTSLLHSWSLAVQFESFVTRGLEFVKETAKFRAWLDQYYVQESSSKISLQGGYYVPSFLSRRTCSSIYRALDGYLQRPMCYIASGPHIHIDAH